MTVKQLRFAQELEHLPAGEVLYRGLLDGLGLMHNRDGMAALGAHLPLATLESVGNGDDDVSALLLGTGGFLPLSPAHAELADISGAVANRVEASFASLAGEWRIEPLPAEAICSG